MASARKKAEKKAQQRRKRIRQVFAVFGIPAPFLVVQYEYLTREVLMQYAAEIHNGWNGRAGEWLTKQLLENRPIPQIVVDHINQSLGDSNAYTQFQRQVGLPKVRRSLRKGA